MYQTLIKRRSDQVTVPSSTTQTQSAFPYRTKPMNSLAKNKTMFNQTCDRLREYMKQNGPLRTMNLEMQNCVLSSVSNVNNVMDEEYHVPKQMTIFYNGKVIVVENVSCEKASDIMRVATSLSLSSAPLPVLETPPSATINNSTSDLGAPIARDMSQTRSRSLTRFFEKRKDRINGRAPYTLRDKSWLGLSSAAPAN